jgi:hypothetical protein
VASPAEVADDAICLPILIDDYEEGLRVWDPVVFANESSKKPAVSADQARLELAHALDGLLSDDVIRRRYIRSVDARGLATVEEVEVRAHHGAGGGGGGGGGVLGVGAPPRPPGAPRPPPRPRPPPPPPPPPRPPPPPAS